MTCSVWLDLPPSPHFQCSTEKWDGASLLIDAPLQSVQNRDGIHIYMSLELSLFSPEAHIGDAVGANVSTYHVQRLNQATKGGD